MICLPGHQTWVEAGVAERFGLHVPASRPPDGARQPRSRLDQEAAKLRVSHTVLFQ